MSRNLRPGPEWVVSVVVERLSPVMYLVETSDHQLWKRHLDQLKEIQGVPENQPRATTVVDDTSFDEVVPRARAPSPAATVSSPSDAISDTPNEREPTPESVVEDHPATSAPVAANRPPKKVYPARDRRPPDRYQ